MKSQRRFLQFAGVLLGLCLALALLPMAASAQGEALELTVLKTSVEARSVTPGGEVAWLGVSRGVDDRYRTRVILLDGVVVDEDHDGAVTLDLEAPVAPLSVWVVVDITSGTIAFANPSGTPVRWAPEGAARFRGQSGQVEVDLKHLQAILVRPGVGAFRAHLVDGGHFDAGPPSDGKVVLTPAAFRRVTRQAGAGQGPPGSPPGQQAPGSPFAGADLLVGIDSRTLEVILLEVE